MKSSDCIIQQIKDGILHEDASVEMKRRLPHKDMQAKVLVGLANAGGGHFSPAELKSLQQACFAAGINPKFSCGALMGGGKPHDTPPSHSIDIAFDLFCIDDMQGSSRLTIK